MEIEWNKICPTDKSLLQAICILLDGHSWIRQYLFTDDFSELREDAEILKKNPFSSGEKLLVTIALDVWNGSGGTRLDEIFHTLDERNYRNLLNAMAFIRSM